MVITLAFIPMVWALVPETVSTASPPFFFSERTEMQHTGFDYEGADAD